MQALRSPSHRLAGLRRMALLMALVMVSVMAQRIRSLVPDVTSFLDGPTMKQDFRDAMARLSAAVNIITTDGPAGRAAMTVSAVSSVSDEPATVLVCINVSSAAHPILVGNGRLCINILAAHHEDVRAETILAPLVDAADALSGARPGARREMMETYTRRLEELERIVNEFKGVEKSYAVQAGREIRIMVQHDLISDDEASRMAREIARKIENEMTYPGQIKVTVIREMRAVDYAK